MSLPSKLSVWNLENPESPVKIGQVFLAADGRRLSFSYEKKWIDNGFMLSGDLPLSMTTLLQKDREITFGAMEDAMPDKWGERVIRYAYKPKRATALDFLYLVGDHRFGLLGFSVEEDKYAPHENYALVRTDSLDSLMRLITKIDNHEPLTGAERMLAGLTRSLGGAHPKSLVEINDEEWVAKFPRGDHLDIPLVKYASLKLAKSAGISIPEAIKIPMSCGHVLALKRFDREIGRRLHALSAKTALLHGVDLLDNPPIHELGYGALSDFLRVHGHPVNQTRERAELFRRMIFNIMIDNTDDHEKNHAVIRKGQYWSLSPAYDVLPLASNIGHHQMIIGNDGAVGSFGNAMSQCERFGLTKDRALQEWKSVSSKVEGWKVFFRECGVMDSDIDYLSDFVGGEKLLPS